MGQPRGQRCSPALGHLTDPDDPRTRRQITVRELSTKLDALENAGTDVHMLGDAGAPVIVHPVDWHRLRSC